MKIYSAREILVLKNDPKLIHNCGATVCEECSAQAFLLKNREIYMRMVPTRWQHYWFLDSMLASSKALPDGGDGRDLADCSCCWRPTGRAGWINLLHILNRRVWLSLSFAPLSILVHRPAYVTCKVHRSSVYVCSVQSDGKLLWLGQIFSYNYYCYPFRKLTVAILMKMFRW